MSIDHTITLIPQEYAREAILHFMREAEHHDMHETLCDVRDEDGDAHARDSDQLHAFAHDLCEMHGHEWLWTAWMHEGYSVKEILRMWGTPIPKERWWENNPLRDGDWYFRRSTTGHLEAEPRRGVFPHEAKMPRKPTEEQSAAIDVYLIAYDTETEPEDVPLTDRYTDDELEFLEILGNKLRK